MNPWDEVLRLVAEGKDPVLRITYSMLAPQVKKKPGRKPRPDRTVTEIQAARVLSNTTRPRCLNPDCRRRLTKGRLTCDEHCRLQALVPYEALVELLRGDADDGEETRTEGDYSNALALRNRYAESLKARVDRGGKRNGRRLDAAGNRTRQPASG